MRVRFIPSADGANAGALVTREGWICARCGASVSPDAPTCPICPARAVAPPLVDCGCPPGGTCNSTACPRAMRVVSAEIRVDPRSVDVPSTVHVYGEGLECKIPGDTGSSGSDCLCPVVQTACGWEYCPRQRPGGPV